MTNLGPKVSYRSYSWEGLVISEWGPQWNMPDIAYEMRNGRKFESTDKYHVGIYAAIHPFGIYWSPLGSIKYPDMVYEHFLLQENYGMILQE